MISSTIRHALVGVICSQSWVGAARADSIKFETMAPKGSALVIAAKDLDATATRFMAGPLGQMLSAPEIAAEVSAARKESERKRSAELQALGIDVESVPWPGPLGLSLFVERNEELDAPEVGLLLWADYGERADAAGKVFDGLIRELEKDAARPFEQVEIQGGIKATRVELPQPAESDDPQDPQPPRRRPPRGMDALGGITQMPEALFFIRVGSQFFAASNIPALEDAIAAASGKQVECVADTEDWRGMTGIVGEQDLSATLIFAPLEELVAPMFAGPMASVPVILKELFGDVRALALTMRGEESSAFIDTSLTAYVLGEKIGLIDLFSESTPIEAPAALLGDEAVTYQRFNIRFGNIMSMIEGVVESLPEYQSDAIAPLLEQYGPGLTKVFSCLGPEVSTLSRKSSDGAGETRAVTAIRCTDEKATNALLATILPQTGLMPRDFQGNIVYGGESLETEFGLGGGALVFGAPQAVEQALRSASDATGKSLSEDPIYRSALAALNGGAVVGWGYTDMPTFIESNQKALAELQSELPEDLVVDPDATEDEDELDVVTPFQFGPATLLPLQKLDHAALSRYVGPLVWDIRSEPKSLSARFRWLPVIPSTK
ncbi:MAG: hypothetical protein EXS01_00295 [Phycisphaerales bacterium]|nr:hypothetical protein [Phycisphaerales bacterium]